MDTPVKLDPPPSLTQKQGTSFTRDLDKRLQRLVFSLPLPLRLRRALALAPTVWLFIAFMCATGWVFLKVSEPREEGGVSPQMQALVQGPEHRFAGGLVWVGREAYGHPVSEMIERAERAYEQERARKPRTMEQFTEAYKAVSGGRQPPEMYEAWASTHPIPPAVPSKELLYYSALHKTVLRRFQEVLEKLPGFFTIQLEGGRAIVFASPGESEEVWGRAEDVNRLVNHFAKILPDIRLTVSALTRPRQSLPYATSQTLSAAFHANKFLRITSPATQDPSPLLSCPPPSPETAKADPIVPGLTFLFNPAEALDPCVHPSLTAHDPKWFKAPHPENGMISNAGPMLGFVGGAGSTDLVMPLPAQVPMSRAEEADLWDMGLGGAEKTPGMAWDRRESKLFWRGRPLRGAHHPIDALLHPSAAKQKILVPRGRGFVWEAMRDPLKGMLDVEMSPYEDWTRERGMYKWLLDLDAEGEDFKFYELLKSGGLVFRSSLYRTWASDNARAWVHYVPILPDMSDLPALLHFFQYHDDLARKIAEAGEAWAEDQERRDEVEGVWFTTLAEYGTMYARKHKPERGQQGRYDLDSDGYVVS